MEKIPVFKPLIEKEEISAAVAALELGWLGMGRYVGEFEDAVRDFVGAQDRYPVAVSTGHAALHLGLALAGVGPGDQVITPSFNNVADFQAIKANGAEPVFCDIDPGTLCIDLEKAEMLISPSTKAVIVMDYDCLLCDHDRVAAFATKHGVRILHDAAHSFGSSYNGHSIGAGSDICMFSFDPVKTLTCIDGGMLMVRTEAEKLALHEMRLIGMAQPATVMYQNQRAWTYDVHRVGFRYHMANLHAAIGLAQLAKMPSISASRQATCRRYNEALGNIPGLITPRTNFTGITPFLYYIRVPTADRDAIRAHLSLRGIDTGIHWQPGHSFTLFENCRRGDLTVTERVSREILSLPLHSMMDQQIQDRVIQSIQEYFHAR